MALIGAAGIGATVAFLPRSGPDRVAAEDRQVAIMVRLLEELAETSDEDAFERPSGPWQINLPDDLGGHSAARAETWMIAAHLEDETGKPLGVTFLLSRFGLQAGAPAPDRSIWDLRALYGGQVTLVQEGRSSTLSEQRLSRGAGTAGHDHEKGEVWLDDWQLTYETAPGGGLLLTASVDGLPVNLELTPVKAARRAGDGDEAPVRGFALPRMEVEGRLGFGPSETRVAGLAWLDRLWGELPFPGGPLAYDRLILQLDDGTDLSVLRSQRRDGRGGSTLDGVIVHAGGEVETFTEEVLEMTAVEHWNPDNGGTPYPVKWQLDGAGFDLRIAPLTETQTQGFLLGGWNGIVSVSGRHDGAEVSGLGTLQLTGYEEL